MSVEHAYQARRPVRPRTSEHTLRWVQAHEPPVVFEEASRHFVDTLLELTHGAIDARVYRADEYAEARGTEWVSRRELIECVQPGDIEMAHCYVASLGAFHDPLWAVELPFLFRGYDHAEHFFEGGLARELMDAMRPLGMRGLAFAYSGGHRIVPTVDTELRCPKDFAGLQLRTSGNPVPEALYDALGARAVGADLDKIAAMTRAGTISGCEITYVRYAATGLDELFNVINETHHSLFTTMTVVNEQWFESLSDTYQAAIVEATESACRMERRTAIREEQVTKDRYTERGASIVRMTDAGKAELREVAAGVVESFIPRFGETLIDGIRAAG